MLHLVLVQHLIYQTNEASIPVSYDSRYMSQRPEQDREYRSELGQSTASEPCKYRIS